MSISAFVRKSALAMVLLLVVGGSLAAWRLDRIRIGGAVEQVQQENADLIADILPPPAYIIEPYLEATLILNDPGRVQDGARRLAALHRSYDERIGYWKQSPLPAPLKQLLIERATPAADGFWRELEGRFIPAMTAGDVRTARASYAQLTAGYARHRAAIDTLVQRATTEQAAVKQEAAHEFTLALTIAALVGLALAVLAVHFFVTMQRRVLRPVAALGEVAHRLAAGESETVPYQDHTDEIGEIAKAFAAFHDTSVARAEADAQHLAQQRHVTAALSKGLIALREGDLTQFVTDDLPGDYAVLKEDINQAVGALREMIQLVSESADGIRQGAREIADASGDLATRTEVTANNIAQATGSLQQIERQIEEGMTVARNTVARADEAIACVETGRAKADRAVQAMDRVNDRARNIDHVIEGLDKISFQTRVLAMNAAVEAGRAGEAGRGFAVVADLVGALAMRAEEEARRARELLTSTQDEIAVAAGAVRETDEAFMAISQDVVTVHDLLGQLSAFNGAQSASVSEIARAMQEMDRATQQNAAMVEQTSAATNHLSGDVAALAERAGAFRFERRRRATPVAVDRRKNRPEVHHYFGNHDDGTPGRPHVEAMAAE